MKLTDEQRALVARYREMENRFSRKPEPVPAAAPRRDRSDLAPGEVRYIDGTMWGCCGKCGTIKRLGGWFGSLHVCTPR